MILLNPNLEAFLAVVEHSTVSMAAQQIGLTQTGVTQRIKALERDLSTPVFTRSRKGMRLTEEGRRLYQHCLEVKDTEGRLRSAIEGAGQEQNVECWVTGPASVISGRVIKQVKKLYSKWPKLQLSYNYDTNKNRIEFLKTGKVDLAIVTTDVDSELECKPIADWEFVMVVPRAWKNRRVENIVQNERFFLYDPSDDICIRYMKEFGFDHLMRKPPLYVNDNPALLELISSEVGYGVLPKEVLSEKIDLKEVSIANKGESLKLPMSLAWYPRREPPKYFSDLIEAIK